MGIKTKLGTWELRLALLSLCLCVSVAPSSLRAQQGTYYPPAGSWAKKAPADLGLDPAKLADAVAFAQSRESNREMDFSDQERIFGTLLDAMTFTWPMLVARLSISTVATLVTGLVTASIISRSLLVQLMPGLILFAGFIPVHITLWDRFPLWYHLTFLLSLAPVTYLGGTGRP
jgi:hypothetical protein